MIRTRDPCPRAAAGVPSSRGGTGLRVLIVHGNRQTRARLEHDFKKDGYIVDVATSGTEAIARVHDGEPDAILLAFELPDGPGFETCRALRRAGLGTPVLILAAEDGTEPAVRSLDAGADDFVRRPVAFEELSARVRAMVRRCQADEGTVLRFESIEMDIANRVVQVDGEVVTLTPREFTLLEYLLRNRRRVVSRATLAERVWGQNGDDDGSNVIDVTISRLRRKLPGARSNLRTVRGLGYMLGDPA